jgi:hypothetical protein
MQVRHRNAHDTVLLEGRVTVDEDSTPIVERQVFEDMLGEDKGYRLCWRRESGAKVESDIGIDGTVDVDI